MSSMRRESANQLDRMQWCQGAFSGSRIGTSAKPSLGTGVKRYPLAARWGGGVLHLGSR